MSLELKNLRKKYATTVSSPDEEYTEKKITVTENELKKMSVKELKEICDQLGLWYKIRTKKADLMKLILNTVSFK